MTHVVDEQTQSRGGQATAAKRRAAAMRCPHCDTPLRIRHSEQQSPVYRDGVMECPSDACGWRGGYSMSLDSTIAISLNPNPEVSLPLSRQARQRMEAAMAHDDSRKTRAGKATRPRY